MQLNKVSLTWYKFWSNSAAQFAAAECVQHVPALSLFAQISPAILAKHSHTSTNLLVITCSYLQTCIWCFWERIYTKDGNLCRQPSAVSAEVGKSVNIRQTQIGLRILWTCACVQCVSLIQWVNGLKIASVSADRKNDEDVKSVSGFVLVAPLASWPSQGSPGIWFAQWESLWNTCQPSKVGIFVLQLTSNQRGISPCRTCYVNTLPPPYHKV